MFLQAFIAPVCGGPRLVYLCLMCGPMCDTCSELMLYCIASNLLELELPLLSVSGGGHLSVYICCLTVCGMVEPSPAIAVATLTYWQM